MTGKGVWRAYECPQCKAQVFLRLPVLVPTPAGVCVPDTRPLIQAMTIHMRTGCPERRRT